MNIIVFECENISIDMRGANPNQKELRPASFKGVMRFWWRAIHGNLPLIKLKKQEDDIFGSTDKKSSFSIKIKKYQGIPKNFEIEFIKSPRCDFDIQSFFELVVLLGGFGKSAKNINQGKIKILTIQVNKQSKITYNEPNNLNDILNLLNSINQSFELKNNEIIGRNFKFNYPMVYRIWIDNGVLNTKFKDNKIFQRKING
ncbi:CRISPR-associated RAMP Cmr1 [hydrothermal vent metagenome]|uniref:CRISPR-associated RAMP Cmr1 n=1 Tax=hydrothermal vent metagenome TaxID=652676 RepID=A0A1W1CF27_9ZZZZ